MKISLNPGKRPSLSLTYIFIFGIGLACMTVAGYFLVEGLSQFSGSGGARNMLIVGGILFQITESLCFISASALTFHSLQWRLMLFTLGLILFCFSIAVMTLAQKTALQTGEAQAQAIDEQRTQIRDQIASLQQVIASYRANADNQSKSIYKDSRAMGQDSINRAAEMEDRKFQLSEKLYELNTARQQTSSDFFHRLEEVTGLPERSTEFYFLVLRSLLLEMSGIILMSFGAHLRAFRTVATPPPVIQPESEKKPELPKKSRRGLWHKSASEALINATDQDTRPEAVPEAATVMAGLSTTLNGSPGRGAGAPEPAQPATAAYQEVTPDKNRKNKVTYLDVPAMKEKDSASGKHATSSHNINYLATLVMELYEQNILRELTPATIRDSLSRYCSHNVTQDTARILSQVINKRLDESC